MIMLGEHYAFSSKELSQSNLPFKRLNKDHWIPMPGNTNAQGRRRKISPGYLWLGDGNYGQRGSRDL